MNAPTTLRASRAPSLAPGRHVPVSALRAYFASDSRRTIQSVLGLVWLLDAGLQFQSFMYSNGFIQFLTSMRPGQPYWLASSMNWTTGIANGHLDFWNTLFGLTQVGIGLGLLYRPTVKLALGASFAWVIFVWCFGEGAGMMFANAASPLTGAPGAVLLYGLIGLLVWPNNRRGGLLGLSGAKVAWAALWIVMGYLWLIAPNSTANATSNAINVAPSGMNWLSRLMAHAVTITKGNGLLIAFLLAAVSITIGVAVAIDWQPRTFLWLAIYLNIIYWVIGQGFGGIPTGTGTDPNAGPLFILLALTLYTLLPIQDKGRQAT
jgi:hypothetical protein